MLANRSLLALLLFGLIYSGTAQAFSDGAFRGGIGYFLENNLGKETTSNSGKASTFGPASYPFFIKYDWAVGTSTFTSPTLLYTPFGRSSAGGSASTKFWHLLLPFGQNFGSSGLDESSFDWYFGPGILDRTTKGKGGIVTLNNGTSTSQFALPGRSVDSRVVTFDLGSSFNYGSSRFAFDLTLEGVTSKKRTYDFMLSYAFTFAGGGYR